ncbi:GNAT family N-acetyltransferase [Paenibacillus lemnae]|uniref:GNAT family N-acetyltransferase n=1 Tax=Paenibacillus lemnae TaxID=1330551 RepID=A0A848MAJ2_PAELE|nr:GNAT family protein [Paenibacillus lemnae]NMO97685.1 GNAT family N-acetyltransferase [Paenibacillus lemnae]
MNVEDIFKELPTLNTERLRLRKLKLEDEQDLFSYCSNDAVARYTTWYKHQTIEDTRIYLDMVLNQYNSHKVAPWGIEDTLTGQIVGTAGFVAWDIKNSKAELGYALSQQYWNQGYMSEAIREIIKFGFEHMKLVRIEARCHPDNIGSSRVMEKNGLLFEGILRKHIFARGVHEDVKMHAIIKDDFNKVE